MLTTLRYFTVLACVALPDAVIGLAIAEASRAAKLLVIRTADGTEETGGLQCRPYQPNRSVASPDRSA
jgi:hypothetical protein